MSGGQLRQADDKYDRTNDQQTRTVTDSRLTANEQNLQRKTTTRGGLAVGQGENTFVNGANNNVSLDTETFIRIKGPTSGFSLTGILHGEKGAFYILLNTTTQAMTIAHESASSSANNRILCPDAVDLVMEATSNQGIMVCYDTTAKRWRVLGRKVITSDIADNSVTYAKMQDITATSRVIGRKTAGAGDPEELTPTDLLTFLKTVDGSGSGLDADLLDGQDSSYYTNITARLGYTPRETLASDRTYYVRTDGSDSNTGLTNTSDGAFLTLQKAWDTVAARDLSTFTATIQIADGTYTAGINAVAVPVGTKPVVIQGNNATPANVLINTTGSGFLANSAAQIMVKNLKIQASGTGIYANHPGAYIQFQNINFGVCGDHVRADTGKIAATGNYTISGGAARHWLAAGIATMLGSGITITLTGTPAWSGQGFNAQSGGQIVLFFVTFSGLATGQRYSATANGVINSFGAGTASTYFPGNSNGVVSSGGQQI